MKGTAHLDDYTVNISFATCRKTVQAQVCTQGLTLITPFSEGVMMGALQQEKEKSRQLGGSGGGVDLSGYATKDDLLTKANVSHTHDNSDVTVTSDILPSTSNINIGSATNRFKGIYVDEAHLATNTLYIGDTPLIGTEGSTISIKADADQNVDVKTQGTGGTKITSAKQVDIVATGVNGLTNIQATNQVNIQAPTINIQGTSNTIQGNTTFTGNVTIQGSTTSEIGRAHV